MSEYFGGVIVEKNAKLFVDVSGQSLIPIDPSISDTLRAQGGIAGRKVTYGIRAEDVGVNLNQLDGFVNFTVFGSELMDAEQFVYAMNGKERIVARAPMTFPTVLQQGVWMNLSSPNAHVFDNESGQSLV